MHHSWLPPDKHHTATTDTHSNPTLSNLLCNQAASVALMVVWEDQDPVLELHNQVDAQVPEDHRPRSDQEQLNQEDQAAVQFPATQMLASVLSLHQTP